MDSRRTAACMCIHIGSRPSPRSHIRMVKMFDLCMFAAIGAVLQVKASEDEKKKVRWLRNAGGGNSRCGHSCSVAGTKFVIIGNSGINNNMNSNAVAGGASHLAVGKGDTFVCCLPQP